MVRILNPKAFLLPISITLNLSKLNFHNICAGFEGLLKMGSSRPESEQDLLRTQCARFFITRRSIWFSTTLDHILFILPALKTDPLWMVSRLLLQEQKTTAALFNHSMLLGQPTRATLP